MTGHARGFTLIELLTVLAIIALLVALVAINLTATALLASTEAKRDRERELLFVGAQYRRAIRRYYDAAPGIPPIPRRFKT